MTSKGEKGILTLYSDVQATSVRWLWYPFIAVGKITLLQGDPGDGKSTMMMNLIAELSKGGKLPDGKAVGLSQRVIYQCSEDGVSDTIKPRLEKCGADCGNVAFINEETYSGLTLDDERIRQAIIEFRPKLVVIDPIQAYLGSDSDLQIAGRARKLMQRLGMWASVYDCAIVLIGHLNKKEGTKGLYRSLGSIDVVAAARSVLQVERDPKNTDVRIVRQIKNSLAPSDGEIKFSITAEQGFQWLECEIAQDPAAEPETPVFESKSEKAAYLIKKLLSEDDMRCIAIRPCEKSNPNAIRWGRLKEGRWCASTLGCRGLAKALFDIMEWDEDLKYRFRGQLVEQGGDKLMLFELDEPEMIKVEEIVLPPKEEESEGETVKKTIYIFPPEWAGTFGQPITSIAQIGILQQEHYAGNWDVLRPASEINEMNIFTADGLNTMLHEAEEIMEGWIDIDGGKQNVNAAEGAGIGD